MKWGTVESKGKDLELPELGLFTQREGPGTARAGPATESGSTLGGPGGSGL